MIEIRLPNINGTTEKEQIDQLKSYIYQLVEQLNWAFNALENASRKEDT